MNDTERNTILKACQEASTALDPIQDALLPFASRQAGALSEYRNALRTLGGKADRFHQEWRDGTEAQLLAALVLCAPKKISSFLASENGRTLPPNAVGFLERLIGEPAFFTSFTVEKDLGDSLFTISDHSSGERRLIHSPALVQLARIKARSHMSLLFTNGACLQAFGVMRYYRSLEPFDFHFYGKMLRPQMHATGGLSALMTAMPEQFMLLDYIAEIPPIAHRSTRLFVFFSSVPLSAFDPTKLDDSFEVEERHGLIRCRLKGSKPPMFAADIYYDGRKKLLSVHAKRREDYERLIRAVKSQAAFSVEPEWKATQNMETVASMFLEKTLPPLEYEKVIEPPDTDAAAQRELAKINAFMHALTERRNAGMRYSLEELAVRHGITLDNARAVEASLQTLGKKWSIVVEGGFADIPRLAPMDVEKMAPQLEDCPLFSLHRGDDVQRLFQTIAPGVERLSRGTRGSRKPATLEDLSRLLEDFDYTEWQEERCTVLKHTLFLLCQKGGAFEDVRDYAAEILKLFWQVLLPEKQRMYIRRFTKQYAIYCRSTLARAGLIEIEAESGDAPSAPGAPFRMKSSAFLSAWISLSGYWRE
jgi:hypothetical protein